MIKVSPIRKYVVEIAQSPMCLCVLLGIEPKTLLLHARRAVYSQAICLTLVKLLNKMF